MNSDQVVSERAILEARIAVGNQAQADLMAIQRECEHEWEEPVETGGWAFRKCGLCHKPHSYPVSPEAIARYDQAQGM